MDPFALFSTAGGGLALDLGARSAANPFNRVDFGGGVTVNRGFTTAQVLIVGVVALVGLIIWRRLK